MSLLSGVLADTVASTTAEGLSNHSCSVVSAVLSALWVDADFSG